MANSKSAKKRIRQNAKRRERNKKVRTKMRTHVKQLEKALEAGDLEKAEQLFPNAESQLDRAVSKGIIPKNRAARKTGRLARRLNQLREQA